jgi:hypothetical protein
MLSRDDPTQCYVNELIRLGLSPPSDSGIAFTNEEDTLVHVRAMRSLQVGATWEDVKNAVRKAYARANGKDKSHL